MSCSFDWFRSKKGGIGDGCFGAQKGCESVQFGTPGSGLGCLCWYVCVLDVEGSFGT